MPPKQMHITTFFQSGLSKLEAAERRAKLFELEAERDRKLLDELRAKQAAVEQAWLDGLKAEANAEAQARHDAESKKLAAQLALLEARREDRATNDLGKKILPVALSAAGSSSSAPEVEEGCLYVGSELAAANQSWLLKAGVTAVLNCTVSSPNFFEETGLLASRIEAENRKEEEEEEEADAEVEKQREDALQLSEARTEPEAVDENAVKVIYFRASLEDSVDSHLADCLEDALSWLDEQLLVHKRSVLVHCQKGQSRSCSFILAYLITRRSMRLRPARRLVARVRPLMSVNAGFLAQLEHLDVATHGPVDDEEESEDEFQRLLEGNSNDIAPEANSSGGSSGSSSSVEVSRKAKKEPASDDMPPPKTSEVMKSDVEGQEAELEESDNEDEKDSEESEEKPRKRSLSASFALTAAAINEAIVSGGRPKRRSAKTSVNYSSQLESPPQTKSTASSKKRRRSLKAKKASSLPPDSLSRWADYFQAKKKPKNDDNAKEQQEAPAAAPAPHATVTAAAVAAPSPSTPLNASSSTSSSSMPLPAGPRKTLAALFGQFK